MSNKIVTMALAATLAAGAAIPGAQADRYRNHDRGYHAYNHGDHHRGRGYWRNGKWIVLGVAAAAAAAAAADNDCYYRHGRRYCR